MSSPPPDGLRATLLLLLAGGGGVEVVRYLLSRGDKRREMIAHNLDLQDKIRFDEATQNVELSKQLREEMRSDNQALRSRVRQAEIRIDGLEEHNARLRLENINLTNRNSFLEREVGKQAIQIQDLNRDVAALSKH